MMTMNHIPISQYGAKLRAEYTVSASSISTTYYKPREGSTFLTIGSELGLKTLTLPFDIYGKSPQDVRRKLSCLDALAGSGKVELYLPDGFYYTALLQSCKAPSPITPCILSCQYTFLGIQHEQKITVTTEKGIVFASGTMPRMDCIVSATVGTDAETYTLAGVIFDHVSKGDKLVLDGMTKRVLVNGAPGAQLTKYL